MRPTRPFFRSVFVVSALAMVSTFLFATDNGSDLSPRTASARMAMPTADLIAHEWGVWRIEQGAVAHLNDLRRELPPLVNVAPNAAPLARPRPRPWGGGNRPPVIRPSPVVVEKPVLFLYASQPTQVRIQVGFLGGSPWFYYPGAQIHNPGINNLPTLTFTGTVAPNGAAPLFRPRRRHWWNHLRSAGGDVFLAADGTAEKFLFFDGPVTFEPSFRINAGAGGVMVASTSTERMLFQVDGAQYSESDVDPVSRTSSPRGQGDMTALRARLDAELRQRGLTEGEARSLLDTWAGELFGGPRRAIYFVPRAAYDRMLPISIFPRPRELVRVGLVIHRI